MAQIGTVVTNTETPAATVPTWDTANAFVVGLADWGATGPVSISNHAGIASTVGPRSGTNTTLYDSLDVFFREGGQTAFVSRVVGASASAASLILQDQSAGNALALTAQYTGAYGNAIQVAVANQSGSVTVTLTDIYGNTLAISPALTTSAAVIAWFATTGYITARALNNNLPGTLVQTSLSGGTSDPAHVTVTSYTTALSAIPASLGPGQVFAPGVTNTTVNGIWTALAAHALANNRVALADIDDNVAAATAVSNVGQTYQGTTTGPIAFWAGNLAAPGVVPNTTRSIPPSAVVAALCARVDQAGNPNVPGAGQSFPLQYCTGPNSIVSGTGAGQTYSTADINTLSTAGINTFANVFGVYQNYGFVSAIPSTVDTIYWQFSHARLRMAITASTQIVAQPFVFSQIDGQGSNILAFGSALAGMLQGYYQIGALYGNTAPQAYSVNVSSSVNPPNQLAQGILAAQLSVRMSPYAQLVTITINSVPITAQINATI